MPLRACFCARSAPQSPAAVSFHCHRRPRSLSSEPIPRSWVARRLRIGSLLSRSCPTPARGTRKLTDPGAARQLMDERQTEEPIQGRARLLGRGRSWQDECPRSGSGGQAVLTRVGPHCSPENPVTTGEARPVLWGRARRFSDLDRWHPCAHGGRAYRCRTLQAQPAASPAEAWPCGKATRLDHALIDARQPSGIDPLLKADQRLLADLKEPLLAAVQVHDQVQHRAEDQDEGH